MLPFHYIGFNPYGSIALKLTCSFILLAVSLFVFYKILILPKLRIKKEASYITGTVIPFFRQIETEFHGKYPVLMCDIDPNFPDLMPEDNNKTCIFFAKNHLEIIGVFNSDLHICIPFDEIIHTSTSFWGDDLSYRIFISIMNSECSYRLEFSTPDIYHRQIEKAYGNYIYNTNNFVRALKKLRK